MNQRVKGVNFIKIYLHPLFVFFAGLHRCQSLVRSERRREREKHGRAWDQTLGVSPGSDLSIRRVQIPVENRLKYLEVSSAFVPNDCRPAPGIGPRPVQRFTVLWKSSCLSLCKGGFHSLNICTCVYPLSPPSFPFEIEMVFAEAIAESDEHLDFFHYIMLTSVGLPLEKEDTGSLHRPHKFFL